MTSMTQTVTCFDTLRARNMQAALMLMPMERLTGFSCSRLQLQAVAASTRKEGISRSIGTCGSSDVTRPNISYIPE
jgi:hypothetical protein